MVVSVGEKEIGVARFVDVPMLVPASAGAPSVLVVEATMLPASSGSATRVVTGATGSPKSLRV